MTTHNKTVSYTLVPSTLALFPELRQATGYTNAELITEGVKLLQESPYLVTDLPEQPYGSGKKAKVFNLPETTVQAIDELAERNNCYRTHVVDVAIRAYADASPGPVDPERGHGSRLLTMVSDEDLLQEVRRRGLTDG
jgi:hypothetical protein